MATLEAVRAGGGASVDLSGLDHRQSRQLAARKMLLAAYERFKGGKSDEKALPLFVEAKRLGLVELPEWAAPLVKRTSVRTIARWLAKDRAGHLLQLAGRPQTGRKSVFERSPDAANWLIGAKLRQPHLNRAQLADLLAFAFPHGVPDAAGVLMSRPDAQAIGRFLKRWMSDPVNCQALIERACELWGRPKLPMATLIKARRIAP